MTKAPTEVQKFWWDDKTIQLPKGLLIKGVSGEAVAVYAKMKGFGAEVRCSLAALAMRLGWSVPKTRKYQQELVVKGWIVLLRDGEADRPRLWWMCSNAFEKPPQDLVEGVSKNSIPAGVVKLRDPQIEGPSKTVPKANNELPQSETKEQTASSVPSTRPPSKKQLAIMPALPWIGYFKQRWELKMNDKWSTESGAVKEILAKQSEGFTFEQFQAKVDVYLSMDSDAYVADNRWGLMVLLKWRWNKITAVAKRDPLARPELAV